METRYHLSTVDTRIAHRLDIYTVRLDRCCHRETPPFLVLVYLHTQSSVKIMLRRWREGSYERFGKWFLALGGEETKKMVIYQSQSVGRGEWPWPFSFSFPLAFLLPLFPLLSPWLFLLPVPSPPLLRCSFSWLYYSLRVLLTVP